MPSLVETEPGTVRGRERGEILEFRNVPYAAPPVGALRFAAPAPPPPWEGERDATAPFGPSAPQAFMEFGGVDLTGVAPGGGHPGDDYLTLNVWAPRSPSERPRPVMVWIHGGAFTMGDKDLPVYDGTAFAQSDIVTVAINYRLGVEGFLPITGTPTNLGLRDMIAALEWVQRNIAAFGGDPGNVTIFGESAGGMAVGCLVASPLTAGLFRRAIAQSGAGSSVLPIAVGRRSAERIARRLGVSADVAGFASRSADDAVAAMMRSGRPGAFDVRDETGLDPFLGFNLIAPVYGDDVLPEHPLTLLQRGIGADVELLIGTTAEESHLWIYATPLRFAPRSVIRWFLRRVTSDGNALYDAYRQADPTRTPRGIWAAALTDMAFRWPARQYAEAHGGPSHVFEFDWRSPALNGRLGAAHGLDLAFTFDTLDVITGDRRIGGDRPSQEVATHMHELWVRFGTGGTLPWPEFEPVGRAVYRIAARRHSSEPIPPAARFTPSLTDRARP